MKCLIKFLLSVFIYLSFLNLYANELKINADYVKINQLERLSEFFGKVKMNHNRSMLKAESVKIHWDSAQKLDYAIALGKNKEALYQDYMPEQNKVFEASARKIEYFPHQHLIVLKGNAVIKQGENQMKAPVIRYDNYHHRIITSYVNKQRTTLILNKYTAYESRTQSKKS